MRRVLVVLGVVVVMVGGMLAMMDGLSFRRELEFRDPLLKLGEPLSVNVQNTRTSGWGGSILEGSTYGPPFDLHVFGTLPQETSVTSVELRALEVTSVDGTTLLSVRSTLLSLVDGETMQAGVVTATKVYSHEVYAFTSATPSSITVSLELVLSGSAAPQRQAITKTFHLNSIRRLSIGSHDWHF